LIEKYIFIIYNSEMHFIKIGVFVSENKKIITKLFVFVCFEKNN